MDEIFKNNPKTMRVKNSQYLKEKQQLIFDINKRKIVY